MKHTLVLLGFLILAGCIGSNGSARQASDPAFDRDTRICQGIAAQAAPYKINQPATTAYTYSERRDISDGCMAEKGWGTGTGSHRARDRDERICRAVATKAVPYELKGDPGNIVYIHNQRRDISDGCMAQKGW